MYTPYTCVVRIHSYAHLRIDCFMRVIYAHLRIDCWTFAVVYFFCNLVHWSLPYSDLCASAHN